MHHFLWSGSLYQVRKTGRFSTAEPCLTGTAGNGETLHGTLRGLPTESKAQLLAGALREHIHEKEYGHFVNNLSSNEARSLGIAALSRHLNQDYEKEFKAWDIDDSGSISRAEFRRYMASVCSVEAMPGDPSEPSQRQLSLFALNSAIPFVVFGFMDNFIMIIGGDVVDDLIGSSFHLSTLACAAVANTFADVLGISVGNTVESVTQRLGLPSANISTKQAKLPNVRRVGLVASAGGILVGCILGMSPLIFMTER